MKNFVFSTELYDNEAKKHAATKVLNEFRKKTSVEGYTHPIKMEYKKFPGNYIKIKHENYRSILTSKNTTVDGHEVRIYVALRMFTRGASEYETFKLSTKSADERAVITGKSSLDWSNYEEKARELLKEPVPVNDNPEMTISENLFISSPLDINHELFDITIFETKEWIHSVSEVDFTDFTNAADKIYDYLYNHLDSLEGWYAIEFKEQAILAYKRQDDNWILAKLVERELNGDYSNRYPKTIPTDFQRGYPYTFLEDQDEWRLMEQDSKSNMVLSSQQVNIVSNHIRYPLFLTGRAGSGKSTLLQYIFAEIILRYVKNRDKEGRELKSPVYLSYSSNLINDAKKLCKTLFEKNNVYKNAMKSMEINYKKYIQPQLSEMFYVFKDLLCDCIEKKYPGTIRKRFPDDKYISFPKFNTMWEKRFGKIRNAARDYGPSISWHVIRTYIKGWDSDSFLTPEDYALIGDKNQSVTVETFKTIYDNVWEKWYSTIEGTWDDQDLAIFCLQEGCIDDRFSAIFCDESQDFTRVEIDVILKSSSFTHRSIKNLDDVNKLPFVFAGDEFQTLNPTGFSWESLRSYFTDRLCSLTGLIPKKGMIPDPEDLTENFRSTRNVVKLANRIQLLRASRFEEFSKPQKSHFSQDGNAVYCISPSDKFTLEKLKEKGVVLIVPANDGESVEKFIMNSALRDIVTFDNGVPEDITILNPTQAKGLEYPNVAIYGFNTNGNGLQLDNLIKWFNKREYNFVKDIELKYQISNAYVAVTRASSNLYIIDDVNKTSFWAFAFNQSEDTKLENDVNKLQNLMFNSLSNARRNQWPENEIGWIEYVKDIDISDENLKFMRTEEHKNDLENRAESLHDAKLMCMAAQFHKSAGNKVEEARCRAKAATYEEKYSEAAEWFEKANMYDEAVNNYWLLLNNKQDSSIVAKIKNLYSYSHNKKTRFCVYTTAPSFRDMKVALNGIVNLLNENLSEQGCTKAWAYIISLMMQNLKIEGKEGFKEISHIAKSFKDLAAFDITVDVSKLASIAYEATAYKEAIEVWDSMDKAERTQEYCKAKLKVEKLPKTIEFYEGTKNPEWFADLLSDLRNNKHVVLNDWHKTIVCKAIRLSKDYRPEFEQYLPYMLRSAENLEKSSQILMEASELGVAINKDVIQAIVEMRYTNLQSWNRPKTAYIDMEVISLFDAIEAVKRIRKSDFQTYLQRALQTMKVNEFCGNNYRKFSRKKNARLVYPELGKVFEQSGRFVYACIFYEWAANQTDETDLKKYFEERWIVCKERQAENDNSEQYRIDAFGKRRQLGIGDKTIPTEPSIDNEGWEKLFTVYAKVSNEIRTDQVKEKPKEEPKNTPDLSVVQDPKNKDVKAETPQGTNGIDKEETNVQTNTCIDTFKFTYEKYSIVYRQRRGELELRDEDEFYGRFSNGSFGEDDDYCVKDGRVIYKENKNVTPFIIEVKNKAMTIKVV